MPVSRAELERALVLAGKVLLALDAEHGTELFEQVSMRDQALDVVRVAALV